MLFHSGGSVPSPRAIEPFSVTTALSSVILLSVWAATAMAFDLQGHRGARGLAPENTLASFTKALEIGVTTLETDMAVTRDYIVVLSHDPRLNPDITRGPDGRWLESEGPAFYHLSYADLQRYDVGRIDPASRYASQFPDQVPVDDARIPTLRQLFDLGEASGKRPRYNIETKLSPLSPDVTPAPDTFARVVVDAVRAANVTDRVTVQSFDWRTLLAVRRLAPQIATVCLTMDTPTWSNLRGPAGKSSPWLAGLDAGSTTVTAPELAKTAGCTTWSPHWRNVDAAKVVLSRSLGLKVVPWTVNETADIAAVIDLGVDGLITDYPDRAREVLSAKGIEVE